LNELLLNLHNHELYVALITNEKLFLNNSSVMISSERFSSHFNEHLYSCYLSVNCLFLKPFPEHASSFCRVRDIRHIIREMMYCIAAESSVIQAPIRAAFDNLTKQLFVVQLICNIYDECKASKLLK
jgi:hypothetical protein